jgi:N utilization substance protein A
MLPSIKLRLTETNYALVYTPVEEISKVIGKQGQNIRLASWLSGYEIDVYRETSKMMMLNW